jgi:hypothetical protein
MKKKPWVFLYLGIIHKMKWKKTINNQLNANVGLWKGERESRFVKVKDLENEG